MEIGEYGSLEEVYLFLVSFLSFFLSFFTFNLLYLINWLTSFFFKTFFSLAGKNVAELRDSTGVKAGVSKVIQGVHDRVLTVSGSLEGVAKVIK